ncbi:major facilitator superfamily domain-containing protein [Penicillium hetheringtonii]|uniref:Major facilitator superfamily domain-containing protein n=1 Tax=Penicillium hetheringtonii TaxID=911720 RepID=A0AAD6D8Y8_9EURO|nr:major facilitator superfamily domain-containing protein [Penicillium hetheringtonii]
MSKEVDSDLSRPSTDEKQAVVELSRKGEKERTYLTGLKLFLVCAAVTLVCFLVLLDTAIIVTAIPVITTKFHSLQDLGWYGSSYQIASACLQPLTGKIYTSFSSKVYYSVAVRLGPGEDSSHGVDTI